jgi:ribosome-binding protein aMBF1 (putative translation factor)
MIKTISLQREFCPPTTVFERSKLVKLGSSLAETWGNENPVRELIIEASRKKRVRTSISELASEWEKDSEMSEHLARARSSLSQKLEEKHGLSLKTLRLSKGLSQKRLADEMATSQSHIARIESGTENITIETCRKLSNALDVDMNRLDAVLLEMRRKSER